MDKQTEETLKRIGRNVPAHLARNITHKEIDTSEEDVARQAMKKLDRAGKDKVKRLIDSGAFRREEVVVNEQVAQQLDQYHTREVQAAKRAGKLADPNDDKWVQEREKRMKNRK